MNQNIVKIINNDKQTFDSLLCHSFNSFLKQHILLNEGEEIIY